MNILVAVLIFCELLAGVGDFLLKSANVANETLQFITIFSDDLQKYHG